MNQDTDRLLREYFRAPAPKGRREFLRRYAPRHVSLVHMLMTQLRYISKLSWLLSLLLFAAAFLLLRVQQWLKGAEWVYGLVPFLVMISVTESVKSCRYGMEELEQSTLFSLQSVVLMRLLLLGAGNLLALLVLSFVSGVNPFAQFLYLLLPYLLTAALGLAAVRRLRGAEGSWLCFAAAVSVAAAQIVLRTYCRACFAERYVPAWAFAVLAAALAAAYESAGLIRTEPHRGLFSV